MKTYTDQEVLAAIRQSGERVLATGQWLKVLALPDSDGFEIAKSIRRLAEQGFLFMVPRQYAVMEKAGTPENVPVKLSKREGWMREVYQLLWREKGSGLPPEKLYRIINQYSSISPKTFRDSLQVIKERGWYREIEQSTGSRIEFHGPAELHVEKMEVE